MGSPHYKRRRSTPTEEYGYVKKNMGMCAGDKCYSKPIRGPGCWANNDDDDDTNDQTLKQENKKD